MQKVSIQLSEKQAAQLLKQLSPSVKIHLVRCWERETWPARFRQLLAQIDRRVQQNPAAAQEALKIVGSARRVFYARRNRH